MPTFSAELDVDSVVIAGTSSWAARMSKGGSDQRRPVHARSGGIRLGCPDIETG